MPNSMETKAPRKKKVCNSKLSGLTGVERYNETKKLFVKCLLENGGRCNRQEMVKYFGMSSSALNYWRTTKHGAFHKAVRDLVDSGVVEADHKGPKKMEVFILHLDIFGKKNKDDSDIKTMPPHVAQHVSYEPSERRAEDNTKPGVNTDVKMALKILLNAVYKHVQSKIYVDNKGTLEKYERENQQLKSRIKELEGVRVDKDSDKMDSFFDDLLE